MNRPQHLITTQPAASAPATDSADTGAAAPNPYIGPRTFTRAEADRFFGRDREARELLALVTSARVVLFYAQSGAGKSSLVNARLVPDLEAEGFEVLPIGRVSGRHFVPPNADQTTSNRPNVFAHNLMLSLDQSSQASNHFAELTLSDFLINLNSDGTRYLYAPPHSNLHSNLHGEAEGDAPNDASFLPNGASSAATDEYTIWPRVLIIDQFEEILTTNLHAWHQRAGFFDELHRAMLDDPYLYMVLVIREDYVAALDPYAHHLPGGLRTRYYMERMDYAAALEAVRNPAADAGRPFATGVAETLVDNLRRVRMTDAGIGAERFIVSEFVEPVQLQVVCYQLWAALRNRPGVQITQDDLAALARGRNLARFVDHALSDFYEHAIAAVVAAPEADVTERELRNWFSNQLITETGTRGLVHRGEETTGGLPNAAVSRLQDQFLIRADARAGGRWYELVHDRFVQPIQQSNLEWMAQRRSPLAADAETWLAMDKTTHKLYEGRQLQEARAWAEAHPADVSELESEFLAASIEAEQQQRARQWRLLAVIVAVLLLLFAGLTVWAVDSRNQAVQERINAERAQTNAAAARDTAVVARQQAQLVADERATQVAIRSTSEAVTQDALATSAAVLEELQRAVEAEIPVTVAPPSGEEGREESDAEVMAESTEATLSSNSILGGSATFVPESWLDLGAVGTRVSSLVTSATPALPTATPDTQATATAVTENLAKVRATQTRVTTNVREATATPVATSATSLGQPLSQERIVWAAWQPFERGHMLWRSDTDTSYVFPNNQSWFLAAPGWDGRSSIPTRGVAPPGLQAPERGFGYAWASNDRIFDGLGWATEREQGFCAAVQAYEAGFVIRSSDANCGQYNHAREPTWYLDSITVFDGGRWRLTAR